MLHFRLHCLRPVGILFSERKNMRKISYEDFRDEVRDSIERKLEETDFYAEFHEVTKNNDVILDGVTILRKGRNDYFRANPTIYINDFYKMYEEGGKDVDEIARMMLEISVDCQSEFTMDPEVFETFEKAKDRIVIRLINTRQNCEILCKGPHMEIMDLSAVFYYLIDSGSDGTYSTHITNEIFDNWGISVDELYEFAVENTKKVVGLKFGPYFPLCVLSNKFSLFGAATILYKDVLESAALLMDCDLYIIPSSVHEVLLVPADSEKYNTERLTDMLTCVNKEVKNTDILSDHLYFYSREKKLMSL